LAGGPDFQSEEELAYELGYRYKHGTLGLSVATLYSRYDGLRSVEQVNPPAPVPIVIANGQDGESYGTEVTAEYLHTNTCQVCAARLGAQTGKASEAQVKAVFLFNFAQFVDWPPEAVPDSQAPLVIGILGGDPFGDFLDATVRGERRGARPFVVQRYQRVEDI